MSIHLNIERVRIPEISNLWHSPKLRKTAVVSFHIMAPPLSINLLAMKIIEAG